MDVTNDPASKLRSNGRVRFWFQVALEWLVVAVCAVAAVASLGLARAEWRRALRPPAIIATD